MGQGDEGSGEVSSGVASALLVSQGCKSRLFRLPTEGLSSTGSVLALSWA